MWWLYILICIIISIFIILFTCIKYISGNQNYWKKYGVPTIARNSNGTFLEKLKLPFHEIDCKTYSGFKSIPNNAIKYGGLIELRKPIIFMIQPDIIKNIFIKDFDYFINRRNIININDDAIDPYFNKMLFNMENQSWKNMRIIMTPTFTTGKIKNMFNIFNTSSLKFIKYIKNSMVSSGGGGGGSDNHKNYYYNELDIREPCSRFTLDVIASSAFGIDSQNFDDKNTTIFIQMSEGFNNSMKFSTMLVLKFVLITFIPKLIKYIGFTFFDRIAIHFFASIIKKTIHEREMAAINNTDNERREDFLQLMLDTKNENLQNDDDEKIKLTDDLIIAQCLLFFLAGFDTTESLLIFICYELALNPDVQEKLFNEINEGLENNNGELSYDILIQMSYLDMVVSETLRKYPPVVRLDRRVNHPYKVPDSNIIWEKDVIVVIPVYSLHYDENYYPNPQKFIPERFTVEQKALRHPYTYMPFGLGPRSCIAMRFALLEVKTAIAHLVHSFKMKPSEKTPIPMTYARTTSLKPKNGLWLNLKSRNTE